MQESQNKSQKLLKNIAAILYVIAASAFLPIACFAKVPDPLHDLVSVAAAALCIFGIVLCVMAAGSLKPILPFALITLFLFLWSASITGASIIPLIFISIAVFAYLCQLLDSNLLLLAAIPAYAIAFLVTNDYILALFSLMAIAAGFILRTAHKAGAQRVSVICRISVTIGVFSLVILLSFLYLNGAPLTLEGFKSFFDTLKEGITKQISEALILATEQLESGLLTEVDLYELASLSVASVFNLLPAITIILLFIVSYLIHSLYIALIIPITEDKKTIQNAVIFRMSVTSAVLFIISFFASAILSGTGNAMYATAAQNIYVIFFPGLSLIAVGFILGLSRGPRASCLGFLFTLALFGFFLYLPYIAFPIASFIGAAVVIISAIRSRKKNDQDI